MVLPLVVGVRKSLAGCGQLAAGDEIPGTGGVRKLRYAMAGRGKRGGARIVYYYLDERMSLYALLAYAKADRTDLTPTERHAVSALASALKATVKETR